MAFSLPVAVARPRCTACPSRPASCSPRTAAVARGLTLIELLVGIALVALLMSVAAPEFTRWGRGTRVGAQAADLQSALAFARSEARRRGVRVTLCAVGATSEGSASPKCAEAARWSSGWILFVDNVHAASNKPGVIDGQDVVLRVGDPLSGSTVTTAGNVAAWLSLTPQGLMRGPTGAAQGSLKVCQPPHARRITVSPVGLVRSSEETCS